MHDQKCSWHSEASGSSYAVITTNERKGRIIGHSEEETDYSALTCSSEYYVEPEDPGPEDMVKGAEAGCWKEKAVGLKKAWETKVGLEQVKKKNQKPTKTTHKNSMNEEGALQLSAELFEIAFGSSSERERDHFIGE